MMSPLYEIIQMYGAPDVVKRKPNPDPQPYDYAHRKKNRERRNYLTSQKTLTYQEFLELSTMKFGSTFIAKRMGFKPGTIHNMREAGRAYLYWQRYNECQN